MTSAPSPILTELSRGEYSDKCAVDALVIRFVRLGSRQTWLAPTLRRFAVLIVLHQAIILAATIEFDSYRFVALLCIRTVVWANTHNGSEIQNIAGCDSQHHFPTIRGILTEFASRYAIKPLI